MNSYHRISSNILASLAFYENSAKLHRNFLCTAKEMGYHALKIVFHGNWTCFDRFRICSGVYKKVFRIFIYLGTLNCIAFIICNLMENVWMLPFHKSIQEFKFIVKNLWISHFKEFLTSITNEIKKCFFCVNTFCSLFVSFYFSCILIDGSALIVWLYLIRCEFTSKRNC